MTSDWPLGSVELKVLDLEREVDFYERFGLSRIDDGAGAATLGAAGRSLLRLTALPGGKERPRHTAGLFHFAILLPREEELGGFLDVLLFFLAALGLDFAELVEGPFELAGEALLMHAEVRERAGLLAERGCRG